MRSAPWALVEGVGLTALNVVSILVLARLLTPAQFGLAAIATGIVAILEFLVTAPFSESLVQRARLSLRHLDSAFWAMAIGGAAVAGACVAAAPLVERAFAQPGLAALLQVGAASCLLAGVSGLPVAVLGRKMRVRQLAVRMLAGRAVHIVASVLLAAFGFGAMSLVAGAVIGSAVSAIALWASFPRRPRADVSLAHLAQLLTFGWVSTLELLLWITIGRAFPAMVGYVHSAETVGYLNFAFRLTDALANFINGITGRFFLPIFSALQSDPPVLNKVFGQATALTAALATPACLGLAVVTPYLVPSAFGPAWHGAVLPSQIIAIAWAALFLLSSVNPYLKARGRPDAAALLAGVAALVTVAGAVYTQHASATAVAAAWAARSVLVIPVTLLVLDRAGGVRPLSFLAPVWRPCLAAGLMATAVWLIGMALRLHPAGVVCSAQVLAGSAIYALTLSALDPGTSKSLLNSLRRKPA